MRPDTQRNDTELSEAVMAEMSALGGALRSDLDVAPGQSRYFWTRQHAHIRERISAQRFGLWWPIAAMVGLALVSFGLLSANRPPSPQPAAAQAVDADDLLLRDIQHSIAQRAPEPLMPASILVQEMTTDPTTDQNTEN